jgi:hypothetical protein
LDIQFYDKNSSPQGSDCVIDRVKINVHRQQNMFEKPKLSQRPENFGFDHNILSIMKLSSNAIALCTVLVAATALSDAEASDRKKLRNGRIERRRNLIKVNAGRQVPGAFGNDFDELIQISDSELERALMDMSMDMSMSMSMPSSNGRSDIGSNGGSSNGGSSTGGSSTGGSSTGGSSTGGSSNGDSSNGGSSDGGSNGGSSDGSSVGGSEGGSGSGGSSIGGGISSSSSEGGVDNGTVIDSAAPGESPSDKANGTDEASAASPGGSSSGSGDLVAPTSSEEPDTKADDSSASSRNFALATIATMAMVVSALL